MNYRFWEKCIFLWFSEWKWNILTKRQTSSSNVMLLYALNSYLNHAETVLYFLMSILYWELINLFMSMSTMKIMDIDLHVKYNKIDLPSSLLPPSCSQLSLIKIWWKLMWWSNLVIRNTLWRRGLVPSMKSVAQLTFKIWQNVYFWMNFFQAMNFQFKRQYFEGGGRNGQKVG